MNTGGTTEKTSLNSFPQHHVTQDITNLLAIEDENFLSVLIKTGLITLLETAVSNVRAPLENISEDNASARSFFISVYIKGN